MANLSVVHQFYQGKQHEIMFPSLKNPTLRMGPLFKERICSYRSKFFPGKGNPFDKAGKEGKIVDLLCLKVYPFNLIVFIRNMLAVAGLLLFMP